jgi:hypothetical protein
MISRTLKRPMFRMGGSANEGITSGLDTPKRGLVDGPGKYSQPSPMKLDYNISQMFPTEAEMTQARQFYKPYFERPEGEGFNRFLMQTGLNLMSATPRGKGFTGLLSTAADAAKQPTAQLFEDIDREKLQKNVADADLFKTIMEQKGLILSEAAGTDQSADVFKDQAMMAELAKIVPQISKTLDELKADPTNQELKDKLQILEGQKKIILGDDPIAEASLEIFIKSPQGATIFNTERKKLLAANPEKYQTETGINEILFTQDTMQVIQQILRGFYAEGGRVGLMAGGGADMGANKVTETATTPQPISSTNQMDFQTLRARLPQEITDDIVRLLSVSPEAFEDFATIQTQQDVDVFNKKYDVNLVLPAEA